MKKLLLIVICLYACAAQAQYYDSREAYLAERNSPDSVRAIWKWKQDSINAPWNDRVHALVKSENEREAAKQKKLAKDSRYLKQYQRAAAGEVWLGMSDDLCLVALTEPNKRRNDYTKSGKTETWIYSGQASGCIGVGCPILDYIITFQNHKAIAISTSN